MPEALPLLLFVIIFFLILSGYPVAFVLGGVSVLFGLLTIGVDFFYLLPLRVFDIMNNYILISVPLFIFMGLMLEKSGLAENLLHTMSMIFGKLRGGLAISVIIVGALLAASTGIVGATVITMGLISLPTMLKKGYSPELATGTIASSGTLGQIIPPSVVLVLLGSVLNVSVGKLFAAAVIPGLLLVGALLSYIIVLAIFRPDSVPGISQEELREFRSKGMWRRIFTSFLLPVSLIVIVLGSIFAGIASPTEAAGLGAAGAVILTLIEYKFDFRNLFRVIPNVMKDTTRLSSMVFMILVGATAFSLVFRGLGGDRYLTTLIQSAELSPYAFLAIVMLIVFVLGFFIDFIEITFIVVPIVAPIFLQFKMDLIWIGILLALNLQTSFLSPPFGFALFYLKGVAPPEVKTNHLYRGIIPFIAIQIFILVLIIFYPDLIYLFKLE